MIYEWLQHIKFIWPHNFMLLAALPFLIGYYIKNNRKQQGALLSSTVQYPIPSSFKTRLRHLPFVLRMLAMACLVIALSRPQHQLPKTRSEGNGIDIMLCMDVSGSMGTSDIKPTRFHVAREVAIDFVNHRPVDRMGLVIFSGESFTKCPLTPDKNTLLHQLKELQIMDGGYLERGTLIGEGLAMAVNRVAKGTSKSKVVILLTDGKEDAPPTRVVDPPTAIEIAKANGVKVYCIGMGSKIQTDDQLVEGYGRIVRNYIDEDLLHTIAEETGGKYFRATDKATLQSIYAQIDQMEKSKITIINYADTTEMFVPFVLAALSLLLIEIYVRFGWLKKIP